MKKLLAGFALAGALFTMGCGEKKTEGTTPAGSTAPAADAAATTPSGDTSGGAAAPSGGGGQ